MNRRASAVQALESRLGHPFKNSSLLERALTHVSVAGGAQDEVHNEILEFLGDRVLGRENDRILGDAMEALLAAVYLDGGLEAARAVFTRFWGEALENTTTVDARDAKTALQEWAATRSLPLPHYRLTERAGSAHAPQFTVEVDIAGYPTASGVGATLRGAQKAAAAAWLAGKDAEA